MFAACDRFVPFAQMDPTATYAVSPCATRHQFILRILAPEYLTALPQFLSTKYPKFPHTLWILVGIESVHGIIVFQGHGIMVSMLSPVIALAAALGSRVLSPFPVATASGCGVPPARQQNFAK